MTGIKIVADENIPLVREAFGTIAAELITVSGRKITPQIVKDADVLLIRSITKVDKTLLEGSSVKMVATATIGTDHVDIEYLKSRDIAFAYAPGCNANSVAEYVLEAVLLIALKKGIPLAGKYIGIIGFGNVGSRVARKAEAVGLRVLRNDPPLKEILPDKDFIGLDELLSLSDIVTLHVPLTRAGKYPTWHLADRSFFKKIKQDAVFINTSRGSVVDEVALKEAIADGRLGGCALDVWENEPNIDIELVKMADIATPHIAGYSYDGKVRGTEMIYRAVCDFLGIEPRWNPKDYMLPPEVSFMRIDEFYMPIEGFLFDKLSIIYDIREDDKSMRKIIDLNARQRPSYFDKLRKEYPIRREFYNTEVEFSEKVPHHIRKIFYDIGFSQPKERI